MIYYVLLRKNKPNEFPYFVTTVYEALEKRGLISNNVISIYLYKSNKYLSGWYRKHEL